MCCYCMNEWINESHIPDFEYGSFGILLFFFRFNTQRKGEIHWSSKSPWHRENQEWSLAEQKPILQIVDKLAEFWSIHFLKSPPECVGFCSHWISHAVNPIQSQKGETDRMFSKLYFLFFQHAQFILWTISNTETMTIKISVGINFVASTWLVHDFLFLWKCLESTCPCY